MWNNFGKTFIEYIFLGYFKKNNKHIQIIGEKHLESIIETNRPAIFISGHFANFELMSMEITKNNIKLATIYRPLNNYFVNPLMEYLRKKYIEIINKTLRRFVNIYPIPNSCTHYFTTNNFHCF